MKYAITSGSVLMKVISGIADFVIKYRSVIVPLVASIVMYNATVAASIVVTKAFNALAMIGAGVQKAWTATKMLAAIAVSLFQRNIKAATADLKIFNATFKTSPLGVFIGLLSAAGTALYMFRDRAKQAREEQERLRKEQAEWRKSISEIDTASDRYAANELARLKSLYDEATNEALSKDKRREAAEKLQSLYPGYLKNVDTEIIMVGKAKDQYEKLKQSIIDAARGRAAADKITENERTILDLEEDIERRKETLDKAQQKYDKAKKHREDVTSRNQSELQGDALGVSREMKSQKNTGRVQEIYDAQSKEQSAKEYRDHAEWAYNKQNQKKKKLIFIKRIII